MGAMNLRVESHGRGGKSTVFLEHDGKTCASTTGVLADRRDRERVLDELVADAPGLDRDAIRDELLQAGARRIAEPVPSGDPRPIDVDEPSTDAELADAIEILRSSELVDQVERDLGEVGIAGEDAYKLTAYLVATSRCLAKPLHAIVRGDSASGKSHVAEKVADLLPREHVVDATHLSPKALYRMEGMLEHRFLLMGERSRQEGAEIEDATKALRELRSRGRLTATVVVDNVPVRYAVEGPIASIETTTKEELFAEDANRCLLLSADESPEQTDRVKSMMNQEAEGRATVAGDSIRRRHVAIQRRLADLESPPKILVPFASKLGAFVPVTRTDVRRTYPMLIRMIQASAFLHRFQRETDSDGRILAGVEDYATVLRIAGPVFNAALGEGTTEPVRRFWESLRGLHGVGDVFTAPALASKLGRERQRVNELLRPLRSLDVVELVEEAKGPHPAEWRVKRSTLPVGGNVLPEPEALR